MHIVDRIIIIIIMITTIGIAIFLFGGYYKSSSKDSSTNNTEIMVNPLFKTKDSIRFNIICIDTTLYNNSIIYVKKKDNITNQSSASDVQFFTDYIREIGRRLLIDTLSIKSI